MPQNSILEVIAMAMTFIGDFVSLTAVVTSGLILLYSGFSALRKKGSPPRPLTNFWATAIATTVLGIMGMVAKNATNSNALPNGFLFDFSNLTIVLLLGAASFMLVTAVILSRS